MDQTSYSRNDNDGGTASGTAGGGGRQQEEGQAKQQSREVARQTQEQASYYAGELRQRVEDQIDTRKEWASGELSGISQALRQTASQLQEQDQDSVGRYADQAAGQVGRLSGYLHEKEASQLIGEVESFARSRPSVFLGGAVVLGIAASRFLKSSSGGAGGSGQGGLKSSEGSDQGSSQDSGTSSRGAAEERG